MPDDRRQDVSDAYGKSELVEMGGGVAASPKEANKILNKRRRSRATRRHNKKHPDEIKHNVFMLGRKNNGAYLKKHESDKKKEAHIDTLVAKSRHQKRGVNQK